MHVHRAAPPYSSVYLSYRGERCVKIHIGSDNREAYEALAKQYFDADNTLRPEAFYNFGSFLKQAMTISNTFRYYRDAIELVIERREKAKREAIEAEYDDQSAITLEETAPTVDSLASDSTGHATEEKLSSGTTSETDTSHDEPRVTPQQVSSPSLQPSEAPQKAENEHHEHHEHHEHQSSTTHHWPKELVAQGISFLSGLAETLKSPEATAQLVDSIVEKDESTGETVLKIPVESKETVSDLLNLIGKMFAK